MGKFLAAIMVTLTLGAAMPAAAGCREEINFIESQARAEEDWLKRETALAMLMEAKREASRQREDSEKMCMQAVERARSQLRHDGARRS